MLLTKDFNIKSFLEDHGIMQVAECHKENFRNQRNLKENKNQDIVEFHTSDYSLNVVEKLDEIPDSLLTKINDAKSRIKKTNKDCKVFVGIFSEANKTTQNRTNYDYDTFSQAMSELKTRLDNKQVIMQADHPDWIFHESVLKGSAVVHEIIEEDINGNPNRISEEYQNALNDTTKPIGERIQILSESNGKPTVKFYGLFTLFGQHKEHFTDYIKNSRLGVSSRGYAMGQSVYAMLKTDNKIILNTEDTGKDFYQLRESGDYLSLYFVRYDLLGLEMETWDFVSRPSVKSADLTNDGNLNKIEKIKKSIENEKFNYNIDVKEDKKDIDNNNNINKEKSTMNFEDIKKYFDSETGKHAFNALVESKQSELTVVKTLTEKQEKSNKDYDEKIVTLENSLKEANESKKVVDGELSTVKTIAEDLKVQLEVSEKKVSDQEVKSFEIHKENVLKEFTKEYIEKIQGDLDACKTSVEFDKHIEMIKKYVSENAYVKNEKESVGEKIKNDSDIPATSEETEVIDQLTEMNKIVAEKASGSNGNKFVEMAMSL
jgi:hypothetical protein